MRWFLFRMISSILTTSCYLQLWPSPECQVVGSDGEHERAYDHRRRQWSLRYSGLHGHQVRIEGAQRWTRAGWANSHHRILWTGCDTISCRSTFGRFVTGWLRLLRLFVLRELSPRSSTRPPVPPLVSTAFTYPLRIWRHTFLASDCYSHQGILNYGFCSPINK